MLLVYLGSNGGQIFNFESQSFRIKQQWILSYLQQLHNTKKKSIKVETQRLNLKSSFLLYKPKLWHLHTLLFLHVGEVFKCEGPHRRSPESISLHDRLQTSPDRDTYRERKIIEHTHKKTPPEQKKKGMLYVCVDQMTRSQSLLLLVFEWILIDL